MTSGPPGKATGQSGPPPPRLRNLLPLLRPVRGQLALAVAFSLGSVVALVAVPLLVGQAVEQIEAGDKAGIARAAVAILGAALLGALSQGARQLLAGRLGLQVEFDLRERYFSHLQSVDLEYISAQSTAQLVSRGTVDLRPLRFFLGAGIPLLVQDLGSILLAAVVMFALDADLAALTLAPLPLVILAIWRYNRAAAPRLEEVRRRIGALAAIAQENIVGVRLVKAFVTERIELDRFKRAAAGMLEAAITATRVQARFTPTLAQLPTLGLVVVLLYGGHQALSGDISVGDFAAFFTYALLLIEPATEIAYVLNLAQQALAADHRVGQVLAHQPAIQSPAQGAPVPSRPGISFQGVSAGYPGRRRVVDRVDLRVGAGQVVALLGETGSGKSTVLSLIHRLYDPEEGSVLIGGRSAKELDLTSLRQEVAVAVDDAFLFSGTVRDNIAYGRLDASDAEIREAARRAQADRFIEALPNGYDTEVGWRGFNLSGGQRTRISIARALIADAGILLLDNVTASLDAHTELEQLAEFARNLREQTTVIVAYRSPALALAHEVVVVRHGRVVARGSHEELLAGNEYYRSLVGPDLRLGDADR